MFAKKKIWKEFQIKINSIYKHYCYLELYCHYLTNCKIFNRTKYIFSDESQDLSIMEIDLIHKVNTINHMISNNSGIVEYPILNLFGDVNQAITKHSIINWKSINFLIEKYYELNENFRNTNQIIDFCNIKLNLNMQKVGVNSRQISEYETIVDYIETLDGSEKLVFITKNEEAKADIKQVMKNWYIDSYTIFTVKEAKGLEFKEVCVIDKGLTRNEKYIAYTRALVQLNIVKFTPHYPALEFPKIIQGDDIETD